MTTTTTHGDKTRTRGNKYNLTPETARVRVQIGKVTSGVLQMLKASAGEARTQSGQTHLHRIPKGDSWVYLLSQIRGKIVCR